MESGNGLIKAAGPALGRVVCRGAHAAKNSNECFPLYI